MNDSKSRVANALWRIYNRAERPSPWTDGGNLPWDDPDFSQRMLREHLDNTHGAASRQRNECTMQIEWLWEKLHLQPGQHLFDVTCGPGLYALPFAQKGLDVTGIDFGPAAIEFARWSLEENPVLTAVTFHQEDIRQMNFAGANFDAAILLYGQLAVMSKAEAEDVLGRIFASLRPGGRLAVELLNQERVDKKDSSWWYTDESGLWGDAPYLHLGERFWNKETAVSTERYQILHLETGMLDEIILGDQTYGVEEMVGLLEKVGFTAVTPHLAWDGLPLYDAEEWILYLATKPTMA